MTVTWEYKTLPDVSSPYNPADRLNKEGSQGWELVCATSNYFVFKRPKLTPDSQSEQKEVAPNPTRKMVATHRGIGLEVWVKHEGTDQEFWEVRCFYPSSIVGGAEKVITGRSKDGALKSAKNEIDLILESAR